MRRKPVFFVSICIILISIAAAVLITGYRSLMTYRIPVPDVRAKPTGVRDLDGIYASVQYAAQSYDLVVNELVSDPEYPVYLIEQPDSGQLYSVLIQGTIHGNEVAGALAVQRILREFSRMEREYPRIRFSFIPLANPYGFRRGSRFNSGGYNAGIDFTRTRSREAKAIAAFVDSRSFDLCIDLHESDGTRNHIILFDRYLLDMGSRFIALAEGEGFDIYSSPTYPVLEKIEDVYGVCYLPRSIIGPMARISGRETLPMRINRHRGTVCVVTETGRQNEREVRIAFDLLLIEFMLDYLGYEWPDH